MPPSFSGIKTLSYFISTTDPAKPDDKSTSAASDSSSTVKEVPVESKTEPAQVVKKSNPLLEKWILKYLSDKNLSIPVDSLQLLDTWSKVHIFPVFFSFKKV